MFSTRSFRSQIKAGAIAQQETIKSSVKMYWSNIAIRRHSLKWSGLNAKDNSPEGVAASVGISARVTLSETH
jgi:hypothetical protein